MSEKFLVTFIFKYKKYLEAQDAKRNSSMIPFISCRSTQSSREGGPGGVTDLEVWGDEKVLELDSGTGDPISCVYLMPPNGTL